MFRCFSICSFYFYQGIIAVPANHILNLFGIDLAVAIPFSIRIDTNPICLSHARLHDLIHNPIHTQFSNKYLEWLDQQDQLFN